MSTTATRPDVSRERRTEIPSFPSAVPPLRVPVHRFGSRTVDFRRRTAVMAIVNRTPDSFFDRGRTFALEDAVAAGRRAVAAGADWIDVGGQPFAPGHRLCAAEECERVLPVIEELRRTTEAILSIDTFEPEVAARAIRAGADVVGDTSGLRDPDMAAVVAESDAHLVVVHSLAAPRTPYPRPEYDDVVLDVVRFLAARADEAVALGVPEERIIVDPGHDLNKNTLHSLELCRRLGEVTALGFPTLAAVSNKDFVGETLGQEKQERLAGSLAAAVTCVLQGARIVRMHDAGAASSAVRMAEAMLGWRHPLVLRHNMAATNSDSPLQGAP